MANFILPTAYDVTQIISVNNNNILENRYLLSDGTIIKLTGFIKNPGYNSLLGVQGVNSCKNLKDFYQLTHKAVVMLLCGVLIKYNKAGQVV